MNLARWITRGEIQHQLVAENDDFGIDGASVCPQTAGVEDRIGGIPGEGDAIP